MEEIQRTRHFVFQVNDYYGLIATKLTIVVAECQIGSFGEKNPLI